MIDLTIPKFGILGSTEKQYNYYFKFLLSKVCELFKIEGLPDSIDKNFLLVNLILSGQVAIAEINSKLYCLVGGEGGKPNEYYRPTILTVSNPVLGSHQFKIHQPKLEDNTAILIHLTPLDDFGPFGLFYGLAPLIHQTATLLADNIVSINCSQVNSRVQSMVAADSEALRKSAEITMKRLYNGEPYAVVQQDLIDRINVNPMVSSSNSNSIQQLVELQTFLVAEFYKNLGIKANGINKKERMITDEINQQDNYISLSYNTMFESVKEGIEEVNKRYGTSIKLSKPDFLTEIIIEGETVEVEEDNNSNVAAADNSETATETETDTTTEDTK